MHINSLVAMSLDSLAEMRLSVVDSLGTVAAAACLLEASAIKAGNVHPTACFLDMNYDHFRCSAEVIGRTIDEYFLQDGVPSVGECIHEMASATKRHVGVNTNLGTLILLGPLLIAANDQPASRRTRAAFQSSVSNVLARLNHSDSKSVYQSIALVNPGGLGRSSKMDANDDPPVSVLDAMRFVQDKDDVAKQWVTDYETVFCLADSLDAWNFAYKEDGGLNWLSGIAAIQIDYLAHNVDSLIARKNGYEVAMEVQRRAAELNGLAFPGHLEKEGLWQDFDAFLRADGHRRNPGTTADLIAAAAFVSLARDESGA